MTKPKYGFGYRYHEVEFDDSETYLTAEQFMQEFMFSQISNVEYHMRQGMPHIFIDGRLMFPKGLCHRWFAGERV